VTVPDDGSNRWHCFIWYYICLSRILEVHSSILNEIIIPDSPSKTIICKSVSLKLLLCENYIAHSLTHGAEPILRSCQLCSHSRTTQHFIEPEGLLPCSQEPSTGPYSEPDQSNS
jgi:hypothetical protein